MDRKRGPRRPESIRRYVTAIHRWATLVIGVVLLTVMTCGVPLLWGAELFRAANSNLYRPTHTAHPISAGEALERVHSAHPDFVAGNVIPDKGMFLVTDSHLNKVYAVDPGTGHITGSGHYYGGFQGFVENLHAYGLSNPSYPGYVPLLGKNVPTLGIDALEGVTYGSFLVGFAGLFLLLLAVSGVFLWWPGIKRIASSFRVRRGKSSYVRNRELHKVVGMVAIPFLLMWGLTGAAVKFPSVQKTWLAVTAGNPSELKSQNWDFASRPVKAGTPDIGVDKAAAAAVATVPGTIHNNTLPAPGDPAAAYLFEISQPGNDPYSETMLAGNGWVYVDRHDASHVKVVWDGKGSTASNTFYEQAVYTSHFGWYVNGWWRIVWALFGLTPLLLAVTGTATWISRRRKQRLRRQRRQQQEQESPVPA
ncbi:PepSY-associated TM helix domain-containing protein [Streptomyces sp. NPDC002520]